MVPSVAELPDIFREVEAQALATPKQDETGYSISSNHLGERRPIRIIVIGFGAGGINIAKILGQPEGNNIEVQCYEKNSEVGGTWYENKYPGCACDIPAVNYQFSWHPKPDWSSYYAGSTEILGYFKDIVAAHNLAGFAKLNHRVIGAWWDDELGEWKIKIQPGDEVDAAFYDRGDILINASGVLNSWKWPAIKGLDKFQAKMHSAAWDDTVDLNDKVVGVIGNGSSAVQIIPAIAPRVKKIVTFMRSSTWITAGFAQKFAGPGGTNFQYTNEQKETFKNNPGEYLQYRKDVENELSRRFKFIINGSAEQKEAIEFSRKEMEQHLKGRPELMDKIIPKNYSVGCRRPTPGNGYLETIADEEKCDVVFSEITEITEEGLITSDGQIHKIDILVCATGFDVGFVPRYPIVGKKGVEIRDVWKDAPETYLSVTASNFPNYFMMNGPYGPFGHGSILPAIELIARHMEKVITKLQTEDVKSFVPKQAAVNDFKRHRELFLKRTAWNSPCRSWFKGGTVDGPIKMWPGSRLHFFKALESPRWEDYDWEYRTNNRFAYFGDGFTKDELDGVYVPWYIEAV